MSNQTYGSVHPGDAQIYRESWSLSRNFQSILFSLPFTFVSLIITSFPHRFDRWVAVSMVLISTYVGFVTSDNFSPDDTLNEVYTRYTLIAGSYMLSMAYRLEPGRKVQPHLNYKTEKPSWSPWYKGYKLMWNARGVGTSWEVPYLWPGVKNTWDTRNGQRSSRHGLGSRSRLCGIAIRLCYIALNFVLLACLYEFFDVQFLLDAQPSDLSPDKEGILRRAAKSFIGIRDITPVTSRELGIRAVSAIENTAGNFLTFSLYHDVCAVFFIAVGLDESWEWPPFFGQIMEAYTMRRWWSMWWHRSVYRSFSSHSELILRPLQLRKRSALYRALTAFIVFGLSAVMHAMVTWKYGNRCAWGRSMLYWMLHPVGFVLEAIAQAAWSRLRTKLHLTESRALNAFERIVGYTWVCGFLVWIAPKQNWALRSCQI